jgi:hypothetical protein
MHPEMQSILQVLGPFPKARQAVSEALAGVRSPKTFHHPGRDALAHALAARAKAASPCALPASTR